MDTPKSPVCLCQTRTRREHSCIHAVSVSGGKNVTFLIQNIPLILNMFLQILIIVINFENLKQT